MSRIGKSVSSEGRLVLSGDEKGKWEVVANRFGVSL
jgi:hypothetical protein